MPDARCRTRDALTTHDIFTSTALSDRDTSTYFDTLSTTSLNDQENSTLIERSRNYIVMKLCRSLSGVDTNGKWNRRISQLIIHELPFNP